MHHKYACVQTKMHIPHVWFPWFPYGTFRNQHNFSYFHKHTRHFQFTHVYLCICAQKHFCIRHFYMYTIHAFKTPDTHTHMCHVKAWILAWKRACVHFHTLHLDMSACVLFIHKRKQEPHVSYHMPTIKENSKRILQFISYEHAYKHARTRTKTHTTVHASSKMETYENSETQVHAATCDTFSVQASRLVQASTSARITRIQVRLLGTRQFTRALRASTPPGCFFLYALTWIIRVNLHCICALHTWLEYTFTQLKYEACLIRLFHHDMISLCMQHWARLTSSHIYFRWRWWQTETTTSACAWDSSLRTVAGRF